jgi:MarR family transcriptional regulator, organic hydroperoxide resistance regulator
MAGMRTPRSRAGDAWLLMVRFFLAQRAQLPTVAAELELSPEPGRPIPMGQLAQTLACDASNITGLVNRLESRGLVRRRAAAGDRRVRVLDLTPTGSRLRSHLLNRMTTPPVTFERLSVRDHRALVRILTRLLD